MTVHRYKQELEEAQRLLEHEQTLEVSLETLDQLLHGDDCHESGIDTLAALLVSARSLPDTLAVRAFVSERVEREPAIETDFRDRCRGRSMHAWREALALRRNGVRQLPRGVLIAAAFGFFAAAMAYLGDAAGNGAGVAPLYVVAGISTIAAWASAWLPIQQTLFDWRALAHEADAYDLLTRSTLEIVGTLADPEDTAMPALVTRTISSRREAAGQLKRDR